MSQARIRESYCKRCKTPCAARLDGSLNLEDPTIACPIGRWERMDWRERQKTEPPLPGLFAQAVNATKAAGRVLRAGARREVVRATPEQFAQRKLICLGCEFFRKSDERCSKCGCSYHLKLKLATERCPVGKW